MPAFHLAGRPRLGTGAARPRAVVRILTGALCAWLLAAGQAGADPLAGSWRLLEYSGGGSTGPASGLLQLNDGHFSLVYVMDEAGEPTAGRAHAGRYRAEGDQLVLRVAWSMERVGGAASVTREEFERRPQFTLQGDRLTLEFENGALQVFRRARYAE